MPRNKRDRPSPPRPYARLLAESEARRNAPPTPAVPAEPPGEPARDDH